MSNALVTSSRNQLGNARNGFQGEAKRVLCVCSAGLLRSPSLAMVLNQDRGYNTRACGTSTEYALIPISQALVHWADEIVFVNEENYRRVCYDEGFIKYSKGRTIKVMDIPDAFEYGEAELLETIRNEYPTAEEM